MSTTGTRPVTAAPKRAGLGVRDGVLDFRDDRLADARRVRGVQPPVLGQHALQPRDRIAPAALVDLVLAAIGLRIAFEVTDPADRVRLDERGTVAAARALAGPH